MKALVTGGSGFVGQYLLEQLIAEGYETRSLNRHPSPLLKKLGVEERLGSLDDFDAVDAAVRGCDVVFHIAAYPSIVMDPAPYYRTNVLGSRNIVAACLRQRVRKLVYTSTQCVANTVESQEGIDESVPYAPQFLGWYQMTKAVAEQFVRAANYAPWTDDYDFLGLDFSEKNFRALAPRLATRPVEKRDPLREDALLTVALRPHLVWGPRDRHLVPRLLQRKRSGALHRVGDGTNRLATIYVENCAEAHLKACEALVPGSPVPGSVYYIAQEEPLNCWRWIDDILALAGEAPVTKSVSFQTAWRVGAVLEKVYSIFNKKKEPSMTRFLATQLAKSYWYDTSRARNELGFTPRVSTQEGMRRLGEYIRESLLEKKS